MGFLVASALLAGISGAVSVLVWAVRRRSRRQAPVQTPALAPAPGPPVLGDVVVLEGHDSWLERGWKLTESSEVEAEVWFLEPSSVLMCLHRPERNLRLVICEMPRWLEEPHTVEWDSSLFVRRRSLALDVVVLGDAPAVPSPSFLSIFEADSRVLVAVWSSTAFWAALGSEVDPYTFERLAAGKATFR